MNTMEDKELQELFAAKRTVEANRRLDKEDETANELFTVDSGG